MNKNLLLICLSLIVTTCFSQEISRNLERKGKLFFKVGTEYRITPLPNDGVSRDLRLLNTNSDLQNSGAAIFYGLDYFVFNRFSLGFNHNFRYTFLHDDDYRFDDFLTNQTRTSEHGLLMGFHFNATYYVNISDKSQLFIRVGISLLNRNSNFTYSEKIFTDEGEFIGVSTNQLSYKIGAKNYAIGYRKNRLEAQIGVYTSNNAPYFVESTSYIIPYIKLGYTIGKL